jgi:hypothetical protein
MEAWKTLLTTDAGLMSLGVILLMLGMGGFLYWKFSKLVRESRPNDR